MIATSEELVKVQNLKSKVHGCWLGKSIGGTLGLPAEGKMERQAFTFYDPVPTTAPPNDDLELQLVWLHLVENAGNTLTRRDFARAWIDHIHYMWDEYGRCRWNLRRGVPVDNLGTFENPFHAAMGSPIRSEIWACLFPGDSDSAAHYAAMDASLDHGTEGIAGEVLFAVMQSAIVAGENLQEAISLALRYLPEDCEIVSAVKFIRENDRQGVMEWDCWKELVVRYGSENFTHAPLNVALTIWALLYGAGDFEKSILLAVNGGYDADCTAATVGATLGFIAGVEGIPSRWVEPIGDHVHIGPGILGINAPKTLDELTDRTLALIGKLEPRRWDGTAWNPPALAVDLATLPGTVSVTPFNIDQSVAWANGEMPVEIKAAGGGQWTWQLARNEPREIICLARHGARLFLNDELLVECPANWAYVPATHRMLVAKVRMPVNPGIGSHTFRLELNQCSPTQEAAVMLIYPNFHLAPWTPDELPHAANL